MIKKFILLTLKLWTALYACNATNTFPLKWTAALTALRPTRSLDPPAWRRWNAGPSSAGIWWAPGRRAGYCRKCPLLPWSSPPLHHWTRKQQARGFVSMWESYHSEKTYHNSHRIRAKHEPLPKTATHSLCGRWPTTRSSCVSLSFDLLSSLKF